MKRSLIIFDYKTYATITFQTIFNRKNMKLLPKNNVPRGDDDYIYRR
jgi:hypothetical protein